MCVFNLVRAGACTSMACLLHRGLLFLILLTFFESLNVVLINMDDVSKIGYSSPS